jgi:hypothetical protein
MRKTSLITLVSICLSIEKTARVFAMEPPMIEEHLFQKSSVEVAQKNLPRKAEKSISQRLGATEHPKAKAGGGGVFTRPPKGGGRGSATPPPK